MPFVLEDGTLRAGVQLAPPLLTLRLAGELDFACLGPLEAIISVDVTNVSTVIIDLTDLTFCDSVGLQTLLDFRALHLAGNRTVHITTPGRIVRRLCAILGQEHCLAASCPTAPGLRHLHLGDPGHFGHHREPVKRLTQRTRSGVDRRH